MKSIFGLMFWFVTIGCTAQSVVDSTLVYRYYSASDSVPEVKTIFNSNMFGKITSQTFYAFDSCSNDFVPIDLMHYVYNNGQLIELLSHERVDGMWLPDYRTIFTYPENDITISEFYEVNGTVETLLWKTVETKGDNGVELISHEIIDSDEGLNQKLRERYVYNGASFVTEGERLIGNDTWKKIYETENNNNEMIFKSFTNNSLVPLWKTDFTRNANDQLTLESVIFHNGISYENYPGKKVFYYYDNIVINPPELDEQCLITIYQYDNKLHVSSKLDLKTIAVYALDEQLLYQKNNPRRNSIVWKGMKGAYWIEVITNDNRKKLEKVMFH